MIMIIIVRDNGDITLNSDDLRSKKVRLQRSHLRAEEPCLVLVEGGEPALNVVKALFQTSVADRTMFRLRIRDAAGKVRAGKWTGNVPGINVVLAHLIATLIAACGLVSTSEQCRRPRAQRLRALPVLVVVVLALLLRCVNVNLGRQRRVDRTARRQSMPEMSNLGL